MISTSNRNRNDKSANEPGECSREKNSDLLLWG